MEPVPTFNPYMGLDKLINFNISNFEIIATLNPNGGSRLCFYTNEVGITSFKAMPIDRTDGYGVVDTIVHFAQDLVKFGYAFGGGYEYNVDATLDRVLAYFDDFDKVIFDLKNSINTFDVKDESQISKLITVKKKLDHINTHLNATSCGIYGLAKTADKGHNKERQAENYKALHKKIDQRCLDVQDLLNTVNRLGSSPKPVEIIQRDGDISQKDLNSLKILANYKKGYLDVDGEGNIINNYDSGIIQGIPGYKGQSKSISNLSRLFFRIFFTNNNAHSPLITEALAGLKEFSVFCNSSVYYDNSIDELIQELITETSKIFEYKKNNAGLIASYTKEIEQSVIGSHGKEIVDGFSYYAEKLNYFLIVKKDSYSRRQIDLLKGMRDTLNFGVYLNKEYGLSSIYKKEYQSMTIAQVTALLINARIEAFLKYLYSMDSEAQKWVGILIPCGYKAGHPGSGAAHSSPVGFRLGPDNQFFMTQYNVGGASLGEAKYKWDLTNAPFHAANFRIPSALFGEPILTFGPYSIEEVSEKIEKIIAQAASHHYGNTPGEAIKKAEEAFQSIFDIDKKVDRKVPDRRFQVVGNCVTRNVLEWMVEVAQLAGEVELINEVMALGQSRSAWRSPDMPLAKPLDS